MDICFENNFNEQAVLAVFSKYETEDKYKGMQEFEWNTTKSRQEVKQENKYKAIQESKRRKEEA